MDNPMTINTIGDIPEIKSYLDRVGAKARSLTTAVVEEKHGSYWIDRVVIRIKHDGTIQAPEKYAPTDIERELIAAAIKSAKWPTLVRPPNLKGSEPFLSDVDSKDVFLFRGEDNQITMVQVRKEFKRRGGGVKKVYLTFTFWSDGVWRNCEPDGELPLFNLEKLKGNSVAFIHEGAKAARHVQSMVESLTVDARSALDAHPWGKDLSGAVHLGWVGGALNPGRTDWSPLKKAGINWVFIVADNDKPGRSAVPFIAEQLRTTTMLVQFRQEFPPCFDLADAFPDEMFVEIGGQRFYNGPQFDDCLHPATWATDKVLIDRKPKLFLRDCFKGEWVYCQGPDLFIHRYRTELQRNEAMLNRALAAFSHSKETAQLIAASFDGRHMGLCYRPDLPDTMVTADETSAINLHEKSRVPSSAGDDTPFREFLEYLVPDKGERRHLMRWIATLIARPEVRMGYGLLMISEKQGIGKTTLAEQILAPLVGERNVSYPSENDLTNPFNEWCACKRLVIISEIYSGHSWKVYNGLKSIITDSKVTVNIKYQRQYKVDNWVHLFACSNSKRALKIQDEDRRWFRPELTETSWAATKFVALRKWLASGGLQIVKNWAEKFGDYVGAHEQAPMTASKQEMIEASRSEAQKEAISVAEALMDRTGPTALAMTDVRAWCASRNEGRMHDTDYELRKAMIIVGALTIEKRISIAQRKQHVLINAALAALLKDLNDPKEVRNLVVQHLKSCLDLMQFREII
jgi:hypothetical protein